MERLAWAHPEGILVLVIRLWNMILATIVEEGLLERLNKDVSLYELASQSLRNT